MSKEPQGETEESRMPLWEHLDELRNRLIASLLVVAAGACVAYYFADTLVWVLEKPLLDLLPEGEKHLYFTGLADKFFIYLQVSLIFAVAGTSPLLFYQLWLFVAPGLYQRERRLALPFVLLATLTFSIGLCFGYFIVVPFGYKFLIEFGGNEKAIITLTEYFSLTLKLLLAIALVFELPVVLMLLAVMGIVNARLLKKNRRFAFVASAVVAAVATPSPDAFTMILVMVPLYLLYEFSVIGVGWIVRRQEKEKAAAEATPDS